MSRGKLDATDLQILADLQNNGRITNVELAKRAGISAPPCLRRVRVLEEKGYIHGYHADLSTDLLGYKVTVFAYVGLKSQAENDLKAFEELVGSWDEVRACYMLSGEIDFLLKIVARDLESFQSFLTSKLTPAPNVGSVKTSLSVRTSFNKPSVPMAQIINDQD